MRTPSREKRPPEREAGTPPAVKSAAREYGEALILAIVLALIIRTFLVQAYKIPSGSMEPTLLIGDHILVNKMIYGLRMPDSFFGLDPLPGVIPYGQYLFRFEPIHHGDVIVFVFPPDPTKDFIKRVIGLPGDKIEVRGRSVYVNGQKIPDSHAYFALGANRIMIAPRDKYGPVVVPKNEIFVMGDNRDRSYDSRFWGFVPIDHVEGRAMFIYWSWNADSSSWLGMIRWSRFGRVIH